MASGRKRKVKSKKVSPSKLKNRNVSRPTKSVSISRAGRLKRPGLKFGLTLAILMGLFYSVWLWQKDDINRAFFFYQHLNATVSGAILTFLGHNIKVIGETISSPAFTVSIKSGCDAFEPTVLFVFAVIAFPAPVLRKIPGVVAGALFLAVLNVIRIVSLFLTGVYFPKAFKTMHIDVWQALFILLAIVFWVAWAMWAGKSNKGSQGTSI